MTMTCEHLWVKNGNVVKSGTLGTKVAIKLLLVLLVKIYLFFSTCKKDFAVSGTVFC